jgi:photosystem II stability/assembly factor-like uncharacterized protein
MMEVRGLRLRTLAGLALLLTLGGSGRAQQWQRLGPEGGMVLSMEAGHDGSLYLGTADGHVFASGDGAKTWELRGRVGTRLDAVVTRIVAGPGDGNRLFAAVWYRDPAAGGGVFESPDRGQSWKVIGLASEAVRALEISQSQPNEIVAGTRTGVFRSTDAGKTWAQISPAGDDEIRNLDSLAVDPRDPDVIYAGTYHLPWLTRDGGKNWKPVIAGIIDDSDIMSLRLDVSNPSRVYMSACSGIYRSENQGEEWIKLQGIPYAARRTQVIVQDRAKPSTLYAGTTEGLWVTRDSGENWTRTTSRDWVVNSIVILDGEAGRPGRVVLGTERGVQVSDDAGVTFAQADRGFTHTIVRQLLADQWKPERLLRILERSGSEIQESTDKGDTWTTISLTLIGHGKTGALNPNEVLDALPSPWGWILRLDNGDLFIWDESKKSWKEWRLIEMGAVHGSTKAVGGKRNSSPVVRRFTPGVVAFSDKDAFVGTKDGVMRCQQSGSCARLKAYGRTGKPTAIWVSAAGSELAVVADAKLGFSRNAGESAVWKDLPANVETISWIDAAESATGETIYLGTLEGLFSSNGETPWQCVEGGLPAGEIDGFLRSPGVWAITERGGLYVSRDNGATWQRIDRDAERGRFTGLVETGPGTLLTGSQSEGLLGLQLRNR